MNIVDQVDLNIVSANPKSTIKIKLLKPPASVASAQPGLAYVRCATVPIITLEGTVKKFLSDVEIRELHAEEGSILDFTAKNSHARSIQAGNLGKVKMTALADSAGASPTYASTSILSTSASEIKFITLNGVILESLDTAQSVKALKVNSKKYKDAATKQKRMSLGGVGRVRPETVGAAGEYVILASGVQKIDVKGASILVDAIQSAIPIVKLSAKAKKIDGVVYGGQLGLAHANPLMRVLAPSIKTISGDAGVADVFVAGYNGDRAPTYNGSIQKISTKTGVLIGEAHVSGLAKPIAFTPAQGGQFQVFTQAP